MLLNSDSTRAVFFDLGHTLLRFDGDFDEVVERSYLVLAEALARAGYPMQPRDFATRFHDVIEDYFQTRDIDLIERPVEDFITAVASEFGVSNLPVAVTNSAMKEMYAVTETHWKLDPAAPPVLLELQRRGMKLGIITNAANAANANRLIDRGLIHPTLSNVFALEDTGDAAYDVHHNLHQGKVGVLCLSPEEGLGVRNEEKRAKHLDAINRFRGI